MTLLDPDLLFVVLHFSCFCIRLQLSSSAVNKEVFKQKEKSLKEFPLKYTPDPDPRGTLVAILKS